MKILFSCEDFSEKSFASLINRARARRRARAREAIKPNLFSLWMVGITAKRTAQDDLFAAPPLSVPRRTFARGLILPQPPFRS